MEQIPRRDVNDGVRCKMNMTVASLNTVSQEAFTEMLGGLFEHSPWIAEGAASRRPFADAEALHAAHCAVLDEASVAQKVALIAAHPDLAGKLAIAGELTAFSTAEQQSARLDQLTPEQFAHITALNEQYRSRFGFPFVICVKDHTQESIFKEFERRVHLDRADEIEAALTQIKRIAWHRLQALLAD